MSGLLSGFRTAVGILMALSSILGMFNEELGQTIGLSGEGHPGRTDSRVESYDPVPSLSLCAFKVIQDRKQSYTVPCWANIVPTSNLN